MNQETQSEVKTGCCDGLLESPFVAGIEEKFKGEEWNDFKCVAYRIYDKAPESIRLYLLDGLHNIKTAMGE